MKFSSGPFTPLGFHSLRFSLVGNIPRNYRTESWVTGNVHAPMINEWCDCVWAGWVTTRPWSQSDHLWAKRYPTISPYANQKPHVCLWLCESTLMDEHTALTVFVSLWHNEENEDHVLKHTSKLLNVCEHPVLRLLSSNVYTLSWYPLVDPLTTHSQSPPPPGLLYSQVWDSLPRSLEDSIKMAHFIP